MPTYWNKIRFLFWKYLDANIIGRADEFLYLNQYFCYNQSNNKTEMNIFSC